MHCSISRLVSSWSVGWDLNRPDLPRVVAEVAHGQAAIQRYCKAFEWAEAHNANRLLTVSAVPI